MPGTTVQTERLLLRLFRPDDVAPLFGILNVPGTLRYFPGSGTPTEKSTQKIIDRSLQHWERHGYGIWAVESLETGELLGRTGLQYIQETDEVEIDFVITGSSCGRGIATEAGQAALKFGFDQVRVSEIVGIVHPENAASRRVLEKLDLKFTGEKTYFGMDCCRYAIARGNL